MKALKSKWTLLFVLFIVLTPFSTVNACSCRQLSSLKDYVLFSEVFRGEVVSIRNYEETTILKEGTVTSGITEITFLVTDNINAGDTKYIIVKDAVQLYSNVPIYCSCGSVNRLPPNNLVVGRQYLVFATDFSDSLIFALDILDERIGVGLRFPDIKKDTQYSEQRKNITDILAVTPNPIETKVYTPLEQYSIDLFYHIVPLVIATEASLLIIVFILKRHNQVVKRILRVITRFLKYLFVILFLAGLPLIFIIALSYLASIIA